MPLRDAPHGIGSAALQHLGRCRRLPPTPRRRAIIASFHTTRTLQARDDGAASSDNHYDTLNIHPDASPAEIKKSFYTLSKTHHPDHNPSDPHASHRFMRISEAYATLSHAEKRARYDRDVLRLRRHHSHHPHSQNSSYHSTNPAGGRPPSGLSRRRGTFTGPPPSFFRSGGWGAHSSKRREAHDESTGGAGTRGTHTPPPPGEGARYHAHGRAGGMGPGQSPFGGGGGHRDDVPHFDHAAHERSHRERDARRAQRRADRDPFVPETGMWGGFALITGVLTVALLGPYVVLGGWMKVSKSGTTARDTAKRRAVDADGSGIKGGKG
ncbi:DnaJ domain-containing protein [Cercophora scortea]|uniref:DnaJ homolog subfamily C member 30, mitochondrial n=1 Tax=Cercophora scortea TaxID=314031 RepID=A0AAE0IP38_9PEZI|nr:DnaJ domain-containing protein [Cercophora scortea]